MPAPMNFVLFNPDELRAESLACYGHPLVKTPHFDRLAAQGTLWDQCHVQHTVCSPSRCSLMTGWYPHVAGHRTLWHLLRPQHPSLFRYLREAGYQVQWFGKNDLYAAESFPACVDHCDYRPGGAHGPNPYTLDAPEYYSFLMEPFPGAPAATSDAQNLLAGLDFLRRWRPGDRPFVLYLPLVFPHPAYSAPPPFHDLYRADDVPSLRPAGLPGKPDYHALIRQYRRLGELPEATFRRIQAVYLGMCSYTDWLLGQLLDTLDQTGLTASTALFAYSDHGDWAGDYGLVEKWPSGLDDCLTRVPLLARVPGGQAGHRVAGPVELFDIMATTLELAGVAARHPHFARSLVGQLQGAPGDLERAVFAEGGYDPHEPHCFEGKPTTGDIGADPRGIYYPKGKQQQDYPDSVCRAVMLRTLTHKLVRRTRGVNELYDLRRDPRELSNLYLEPAAAGVRAQLEARLLEWQLHTADVVPHEPDPRGLPPKA